MNAMVSIALVLLLHGTTFIDAIDKSRWSKTPPMGWNSCFKFPCERNCALAPNTCIGERLVNRTMAAMVALELNKAGYRYVVLDNCWENVNRESSSLKYSVNVAQFPSGIESVVQNAKKLNLSFGLQYYEACDGRDTMAIDANDAVEYGLGLVKIDACAEKRFADFSKALKKSRKSILVACSLDKLIWNFQNKLSSMDLDPIVENCDIWRLFYKNLDFTYTFVLLDTFNANPNIISSNSRPYRWYDFGTLGIGNVVTHPEQQRTQMIVWCLFSSPLFFSADLDTLDQYSLKLLKNPYLIALNQDPKGNPPTYIGTKHALMLYVRELSEQNTWVIAFLNRHGAQLTTIVSLADMNIKLVGQGQNKYKLTELTADKEVASLGLNDRFDVVVKPFDTQIYKVQYLTGKKLSKKN